MSTQVKTSPFDTFVNNILNTVNGVIAVCVVEIDTGMTLASHSYTDFDPEVASAYNVEVVKSKFKAIKALGIKESIDDILITLSSQYHIISVSKKGKHMVYLAADRQQANLALARNTMRLEIQKLEKSF
ncbi:MAG: hypothetical protein CMP48_22885 [Rickettsiales bacterium]|nr:hypothetical protein [Rickettsiales bacterium]|tara:strand:+ start:183 stop:569 length:387 start_codon:yes stop_codon:yes gene_type:complete